MPPISFRYPSYLTREDTVGYYRHRIFYWFTVFGVLSITPFAIYAFYAGKQLQALFALTMVLVFFVDGVSMHLGERPPVPRDLVFVAIVSNLCIAVIENKGIGVLWTYPALLFFSFVLAPRQANVLNVMMIAVISALAFEYVGLPFAARTMVSLLLTLGLANVFMSIVQELQQRLVSQALNDPLTGIFNRRHFEASVESELARVTRTGNRSTLLLMDIDLFKPINDEHGHATGDRVLIEVVGIIRNTIRQSDVLFRIGGEEFVVLLSDTSRETAGIVAEKIRAAVAGTAILDDRTVTLSIGLSELRPGEDRRGLLGRCDVALYKAKERGRNRIELA